MRESFVWGLLLGATFVWSAFVLIAGLIRPLKKHGPAKRSLKFAVLICARNEERVIRLPVESLRQAEYPPEAREIIVLADNCTDATASVAAAAGATVWEKTTPSACKGDVLAWGLERLFERGGFDAVAVFDADNRVSPGWFAAMNAALQDGESVVTGCRQASNARASVISGWYAVYWDLINELSNRARTRLGLSGKLTGTGFAFLPSALGRNGWSTQTLVEDVEFTLQTNLSGLRVAYVPEAEYADEQPETCRPMWRQLRRWATGGWQVLAHYSLTWLKTIVRHPSMRLFDAYFVLLTGVSLSFVYFANLLGFVLKLLPGIEAGSLFGVALGLLTSTVGLTIALAVLSLLLSPRSGWPKFLSVVTFPVFTFVIALSVLASLVLPTRRWKPIRHTGASSEENSNT